VRFAKDIIAAEQTGRRMIFFRLGFLRRRPVVDLQFIVNRAR